MLRHLITRLQQALGLLVPENASLYIRDLGNEQAERFGGGLTYLFNDGTERFGPVKDCEVHIRQKTIKK